MTMTLFAVDPVGAALEQLSVEAERAGIPWQAVDGEPRRRGFVVPFSDGRTQPVIAAAVDDDEVGPRLQLVSIVGDVPEDARLLLKLLYVAGETSRARVAALSPDLPEICVTATFVASELKDGCAPRLVEAMQEVAALADILAEEVGQPD